MSKINLFSSCHVILNTTPDLSGGVVFLHPFPLPEVIKLYSSSHTYNIKVNNELKGGTAVQPGSLYDYGFTGTGLGAVDGMCLDYSNQITNIANTLGQANTALNSPFKLLRTELNNLIGQVATPTNELNDGISDISDAATNSIPPLPDVSRLDNLLQNCGIMENDLLSGVKSPASILDNFSNESTNVLNNNVNSATDKLMGLVETPLSLLTNEINAILKPFGIPDLLTQFDKIIECMSGICGRNFDLPSQSFFVEGSKIQPETLENCIDKIDDRLSEIEKFNESVTCWEKYPPIQPDQQTYANWLDDQVAYVNSQIVDMGLDDSGEFNPDSFTSEYPVDEGIKENSKTLASSIEEELDKAKEEVEKATKELEIGLELILNPKPPISKTLKNYYT